jgi:3-dehydroquinate synthase
VSTGAVQVDLPGRAYTVHIARGALGLAAGGARAVLGDKARRVLVVRDSGVPDSFVANLVSGLGGQGFETRVCTITPDEAIKTLETVSGLLVEAAGFGLTRVDGVIALGGGVVGDIAGFVAASYQRGVAVIQCPSTLLSMVDASVGGKTGVNLTVGDTLYKNMVGAFHQPGMVIADTALLDSLDARQRRCGLAECVKHAMICGSVPDPEGTHAGLLRWMRANLDAIAAFEHAAIDALVMRHVALKASVVMSDEHESPDARAGGRMLLNLGHTFGHAIETLSRVSPSGDPADAPLHHGEAVALGLHCACAAGEAMGRCGPEVRGVLLEMLGAIGLPMRVSGLPGNDEIVARMVHDKKAAGGSLRVIVPDGLGRCSIVADPDEAVLRAGIDAIRA